MLLCGASASLTKLFVFKSFATTFGGPCWPNNRMQVFGTSSLASFFDTRISAHLYIQSLYFDTLQ